MSCTMLPAAKPLFAMNSTAIRGFGRKRKPTTGPVSQSSVRMDKGGQWVEYTEKLFRGGKLEATTVSVCRPIPGSND
jgi:hypothetical protein